MDTLSLGLTILSAMITPAVLISACGTLILSTSNRLNRIIDRVREVADSFDQLTHEDSLDALGQRKLAQIFDQLHQLTRRVRLLQLGLTTFYLAVGVFVATIMAIGVIEVTDQQYGWIPVVFAFIGAGFLLGGSMLLIIEAHLAVKTTYREMDFLWDIGKQDAPDDLLEQRKGARAALQALMKSRK